MFYHFKNDIMQKEDKRLFQGGARAGEGGGNDTTDSQEI